MAVRSPDQIVVASRRRERAEAVVPWTRERTDAIVEVESDIETAVSTADVVITATSARSPILMSGWIRRGTHITAIGSDNVYKRELDPDLLRTATLVVADDLAQSRALGELKGIGDEELRHPLVSFGAILLGLDGGRDSDKDITIADFSGLGIQDTTIAETALNLLES